MDLTLIREPTDGDHTFGVLFVNGHYQCFTLEDMIRAPGVPKVPGKTAIPAGRYPLSITFSPKFQKRLPLVHGVPGFEGIRIHSGNRAGDTEGCILVGLGRDDMSLVMSRIAFDNLFAKLQAVPTTEPIWLTVVSAGRLESMT